MRIRVNSKTIVDTICPLENSHAPVIDYVEGEFLINGKPASFEEFSALLAASPQFTARAQRELSKAYRGEAYEYFDL